MREEHRCDAMRKSNTGRRRGNDVYEYGVATMAAVVVVFQLCCLHVTLAAPTAYDSLLPQTGEIAEYFSNNEYISGCYYNFQRYEEGDRIVTNEPCLNCTCHNRMLMCYLRVCPFTKAIGQDCTIEKKPDQCCPIITCPEVPVKLLTSSTTSSPTPTTQTTEIGFHDNYGCSIDDSFYADGAQVPSDSRKPCELCYCIRNRTACVMQECTLHVEGCKPVYQEGICCPVRYDCDYEKEIMSTPRLQTSGGVIKSTTYASAVDCQYGNQSYSDGESITTDKPCEHCYCMRGDIVCAVQDCGEPLRGKDCVPTMPPPEKCCPSSYHCTNDTLSTTEGITNGSNEYNTEAPTTFEKSTPYPTHTSSVLTPDEIYTKLGENKTPESENSPKPVTSSPTHPSEGIQMDSNNVDAGEHFSTTTPTSTTTTSNVHKYDQPSSASHTLSPIDQFTTAGEIHTTLFEKHHSVGKPQTTVIIGDVPTTVLPDFSSIGTVDDVTNATITKTSKPSELYSSVSTSEDSQPTTAGYVKLTETTKYDLSETSEQGTEKVTLYLEKSTESYASVSNEIIDEGPSTNKPNEVDQKLPDDTSTKVPFESNPPVTIEVNEYTTNGVFHKIGSTTQDNPVTETKNTISNKNTESIGDDGAEQPTQHTVHQGISDGGAEGSGTQTEPPLPVASVDGDVQEPVQTITHHVDIPVVSTQEPGSSTTSEVPFSSVYSTETHTEPTAQTTIQEVPPVSIDNKQSATNPTTVYPEVPASNKHPIETTIINLSSADTTNSPVTTSSSFSEVAEQVSSSERPQTTFHPSPLDKVDVPESQTNVYQQSSSGVDTSAPVETTTYHVPSVEYDISVSSQTKQPMKEVAADGADSSVPYTKQPDPDTTHQATSSVYETTVTYSSPVDDVSASSETGDISVSSSSVEPTHTTDTSAVIPGEGSCLVDGITYPNSSIIESSNPCHSKCICLSSIPTCTLITCSNPPPDDPKCMPVQIKQESCCPVYVCNGDETPAAVPTIASDNHIAQNELEAALTTKQSDLQTSSESTPTHSDSDENSIDVREKLTSIAPASTTLEQTSTSTHIPETVISDEVHEILSDNAHDENEISNEVSPSTEASVLPSAADSQLKNTSHHTALSNNNADSTSQQPELISENVTSHGEHTGTSVDEVSANDVTTTEEVSSSSNEAISLSSTEEVSSSYTEEVSSSSTKEVSSSSTKEVSSSSSQHEYTVVVTESIASTDIQSETTTQNKGEIVESNEIGASPEYEKDAVTTQQAVPSADEVSVTMSQESYTTVQPNIVPDDTSIATAFSSSSSEYVEIKTTTNEPYQNVKDETTLAPPAEPSHEIYSTSSEYTTVTDDSNDIITAPPDMPVASSSSENPINEFSSVYETTAKPQELENQTIETSSSIPIDHSEDIGGPTTIINEVYQTETPSEEYSSQAAPALENKFQEKLSTPVLSYETEVYQSVTTGSATPVSASVSSEISSENTTGAYETTVVIDEAEVASTKQPIGEYSSYSTSTSQPEIGSSTLVYYSTTSQPSSEAVTEHEVTEIKTQPAVQVASSSETTPEPQYVDTKSTLAPSHHIPEESSTDAITTSAVSVSEVSTVQSSVSSYQPSQSPTSPSPAEIITTTKEEEAAPTTVAASSTSFWSSIPEKVASLLNQTTSSPASTSSSTVTYPPIQHSTWTRKPIDEESTSESSYYPPQPPMYPPGIENGNVDGSQLEEYDEENGAFGPGTCRYAGKVYVSAQQIPRDDPCDFCFCFRSDIICLQQSCPPPIHGCRQEPIEGFCCPRYECPVTSYGSNSHNTSLSTSTTSTTTTTTTTVAPSRPPRYPHESYRSAARRTGCVIHGYFYNVGDEIAIASGPCLECICGSDGRMKCDPKSCSPEPHVRRAIAESK